MKLAQAVSVDMCSAALRRLLEPRQLSVRTPGGAELLASMLRAWVRRDTGEVLLQLDLAKAYGVMLRAPALEAVRAVCPQLAPQLAMQRAEGTTVAWARCDGRW